ncbi:PREDICTED: RNA polymerase II elongation factor ELL3 [Calidris pugnax]|uniref:RNA polymerase II elongation factor ELL3 n=1 Tax=Calidris pugnax TaxID=198806 RepID=UPI00071D87A7|nr:PREDICTED: RNA polymerase II elongation factor ELL3 [Calidris pugnax]
MASTEGEDREGDWDTRGRRGAGRTEGDRGTQSCRGAMETGETRAAVALGDRGGRWNPGWPGVSGSGDRGDRGTGRAPAGRGAGAGAPAGGSRGRRGGSAGGRGGRGSDGPSRWQCLTVPGDPGTLPRLFAFSLSRCGRDEPRGSFECVRLAEPRLGQSWLHSLGSIQEKITVCAWESTHCLSPAKEPCSRAVVEPDPAVLGYGKGIAASEKVGVTGSLGKGSVCRVHVPTTASPRASRHRLAQPRAPQPRPKHKLEGTPAGRPGQAQLLVAVEEVTGMDPAACCCHGRGTLAGRAQEDWPGTMAQEQQQDAPLQHRSWDCGPSALSFLVPLQQPPEHSSPRATGRNLLGVKHLGLLDSSDPRASKRHWSCPRMLNTQHPGLWVQQQAVPLAPSSHAGELESPRSEEERGDGWEERVQCLEQHLSVPRDARPQATSSSLAEVPDYLWYRTICSSEQRRAYEAAFSADYGEYCDLHARVGSVSRRFVQLGAKMKTLKQGTKERKARGRPGARRCDAAMLRPHSLPPFGFQALEAAIVDEYRHFKKTYPSYQQEKNRCEYLHQKLSHIKSLILQFEGSGSS